MPCPALMVSSQLAWSLVPEPSRRGSTGARRRCGECPSGATRRSELAVRSVAATLPDAPVQHPNCLVRHSIADTRGAAADEWAMVPPDRSGPRTALAAVSPTRTGSHGNLGMRHSSQLARLVQKSSLRERSMLNVSPHSQTVGNPNPSPFHYAHLRIPMQSMRPRIRVAGHVHAGRAEPMPEVRRAPTRKAMVSILHH